MNSRTKDHNKGSLLIPGYFKILSIDIVAGAIAASVFAFKASDIPIDFNYLICLAGAVFCIYLADHLLDASKTVNSQRYKFYKLHRIKLRFILIVTTLATGVAAILLLQTKIIIAGICTAFIVALYLLINSRPAAKYFKAIPREFIISVLYIAGTWGGPLLLSNHSFDIHRILLLSVYFSLVLTNTLMCSYYSIIEDRKDGVFSFFTAENNKRRSTILTYLFVAIYLQMLMFVVFKVNWKFAAILGLQTLIIHFLYVLRRKIKSSNTLIGITDFAFIIPLLAVFI